MTGGVDWLHTTGLLGVKLSRVGQQRVRAGGG